MAVLKANQSYPVETRESLTEIAVPTPDLKIDFDGFFTFSSDAFFLPKSIGFSDLEHAERFGAEYVLAKDYHPFRVGDFVRGSAEISLKDIDQTGNLVVEMAQKGGKTDRWQVDDLHVTLLRDPLDFFRLREMLSVRMKALFQRFSL